MFWYAVCTARSSAHSVMRNQTCCLVSGAIIVESFKWRPILETNPKMPFWTKSLTWIVVLIGCRIGDASVMVTMDHVFVTPGSSAFVGVYASSDANDVISGFNLPLDINNDGTAAIPTGFVLANPTVQNVLYPNTMYDIPPSVVPANVDAIPTGSGANVPLTVALMKLFDLVINVDASVPVGTVLPMQIIVPASPLQSLFNIAGPNNPTVSLPTLGMPTMGSITVVPEAGCGGLILLVLLGTMKLRRY